MLTKITIENFKGLPKCEIELGQTVVFVGPNNSGKTTALQALSLWETGVRFWLSKRSEKSLPGKRPGITIGRRDLIAVPVANTRFLWQNQSVRIGTTNKETKQKTENVHITITVEGRFDNQPWSCGLEFDYANADSFYCRPTKDESNILRKATEEQIRQLRELRVGFLPPMSGLASPEIKLELGSIDVKIGEGRTAEVLRNLCYSLCIDKDKKFWESLCKRLKKLFGITLQEPSYDIARGEISLYYTEQRGGHKTEPLEISSIGRGSQQVLLILTFFYLHPGAVILLDEPDAHLEILRQREIFETIKETAREQHGQVIAATHSEVVLNESAAHDIVVAFLGKPHKLNDKSQLIKSLSSIGWEDYYKAEQKGWVLYLEGSTDFDNLFAFAKLLHHPAQKYLENVFSHYIGDNTISKAENHFYGLREAKTDLLGFVLLDRIPDTKIKSDAALVEHSLKRRELENYFCSLEVLVRWAKGTNPDEGLFLRADIAEQAMCESIADIERGLQLVRPDIDDIWSKDVKSSDEVLTPILIQYAKRMKQTALPKSRFHELILFLKPEEADKEIIQILDDIHQIASRVQTTY
ncbi:MAG: AAA family ATPase [Planctomycetaceae bacterium]|jgi:AAA15 family ATPase/GTPase|nr:AAA family ATPase [Planctomycetaceae bacterium]